MTGDELARLRAEHEDKFVGDLIYKRVSVLVNRLLSRRNPETYMGNFHGSDARADVVQGFFTDVLIEESQLVYVFGAVDDIDGFDRLIQFQARRYLAKTRVRTVVDNLLERSVNFLRSAKNVEVSKFGDREFFSLATTSGQLALDKEACLSRAVAIARPIPKLASRGDERAPAVYSGEALEQVLSILLETCGEPVGLAELDGFFSSLLTGWKPSFLGLSAELDPPDAAVLPGDDVLARNLAGSLARTMTPEEREIFLFKYANLPDRELAAHLKVSRQTLSPRKQELFSRLKDDLTGVSTDVQIVVLEHLASVLAVSKGGDK
jgi:hypothetical protein